MDVEVAVSNYRCFAETPARFALKTGLQWFIGINNSGKSCLLRLFYELRNIFVQMGNQCVAVTVTYQAYILGPTNTYPITTVSTRVDCVNGEKDQISGNPGSYNQTYISGTLP